MLSLSSSPKIFVIPFKIANTFNRLKIRYSIDKTKNKIPVLLISSCFKKPMAITKNDINETAIIVIVKIT